MKPLDSLSGSQRQMVGLAQVLVRNTPLLLLDEPTSALDLRWQLLALEAMRDAASRRAAIIVVAMHDLNLASRFCDRMVLLGPDGVLADGLPSEVLEPTRVCGRCAGRTHFGGGAPHTRRAGGSWRRLRDDGPVSAAALSGLFIGMRAAEMRACTLRSLRRLFLVHIDSHRRCGSRCLATEAIYIQPRNVTFSASPFLCASVNVRWLRARSNPNRRDDASARLSPSSRFEPNTVLINPANAALFDSTRRLLSASTQAPSAVLSPILLIDGCIRSRS
ncbi:ABC transporter family protein [Burkholderia humptydooensis]|uniref:ABC transporter related protein n=1 Tax=Burkholderia humptydooensis MSMB43 TaxID=441157 RepID=A0ABN0GAC1_9BURK|nr:ABC transporter family protein [Burkholderia sp. 2002721687]EIP89178.1 ABC transporter related protein [Burkholderia humptydooensis MSMB43]